MNSIFAAKATICFRHFCFHLLSLLCSITLLAQTTNEKLLLKSNVQADEVQLQWQADTSVIDHFVIEHSTDGVVFKTAGVVRYNAKTELYAYEATLLKGINFFRVRVVTPEGDAGYSNAVEHFLGAKRTISVFPNPSGGRFTVSHPMASGKEVLQVTDMQGVLLQQVPVARAAVHTSIDLSHLQKGSYNLIWTGEVDKANLKIFIQ